MHHMQVPPPKKPKDWSKNPMGAILYPCPLIWLTQNISPIQVVLLTSKPLNSIIPCWRFLIRNIIIMGCFYSFFPTKLRDWLAYTRGCRAQREGWRDWTYHTRGWREESWNCCCKQDDYTNTTKEDKIAEEGAIQWAGHRGTSSGFLADTWSWESGKLWIKIASCFEKVWYFSVEGLDMQPLVGAFFGKEKFWSGIEGLDNLPVERELYLKVLCRCYFLLCCLLLQTSKSDLWLRVWTPLSQGLV